jgi:regulator of protease activity HflC (stomatin/prohibitin superfamily)
MFSSSNSTSPANILTFDGLLSILARVAWVVFVLYTAIFFIWTLRRYGVTLALIRLLSYRVMLPLLVVISITLVSLALVFVQPQEVAVVVSIIAPGGVRPQPLRAGLHWIIPVLETEVRYPIYWQTYTMSGKFSEGEKLGNDSIRARTSDGQEVSLDSSIIFRIDQEQVISIHIDWQNRYIHDLVRPVIRGIVRTQVSQFRVYEVNSSARRDLEATLDRLLREELGDKGLLVDQFLLRDISFTPEYAAAIEHKQVALEGEEQKRHEAQQLRNLAEGRADAIEIEAQAQAAALKLIGAALTQNEDLVTYHYVDKLSPNIRVMLVPNTSPLILPLAELEAMGAMSETITPTTTLTVSPTATIVPARQ